MLPRWNSPFELVRLTLKAPFVRLVDKAGPYGVISHVPPFPILTFPGASRVTQWSVCHLLVGSPEFW
jgi:hypothetical protein